MLPNQLRPARAHLIVSGTGTLAASFWALWLAGGGGSLWVEFVLANLWMQLESSEPGPVPGALLFSLFAKPFPGSLRGCSGRIIHGWCLSFMDSDSHSLV